MTSVLGTDLGGGYTAGWYYELRASSTGDSRPWVALAAPSVASCRSGTRSSPESLPGHWPDCQSSQNLH